MNGSLYSSSNIMYAKTSNYDPFYKPASNGPCLCYEPHQEPTTPMIDISALSSPSSTSSCSFSPSDTDMSWDHDQYPSPRTFDSIIQDYLQNLSTKKRDKALVDQPRYELILQVLKDPRNTAISTAQFRFWVKKMFQLVRTKTTCMVYHDNKPVARQELIYSILVQAHKQAHHGGRDKTSALVRKQYSWIPKELIARFVRKCPFCISRRNGHIRSTRQPNHSLESSSHQHDNNNLVMDASTIAASAAAAATQWIDPSVYYYARRMTDQRYDYSMTVPVLMQDESPDYYASTISMELLSHH